METKRYKPGVLSPELQTAVTEQVVAALKEDVGSGDLSAAAMPNKNVGAAVLSHTAGVLAGVFWFNEVFAQIDTGITVHWQLRDGDTIEPEQTLCRVHGNGRGILSGERCALNFLQTLSATATAAAEFVKRSSGKVKIMDTRKTIPGLRTAQKYAAVCGGVSNHRQGLFDGILLKENHIHLCGSIKNAVNKIRRVHNQTPIEAEVENIRQVREALAANVDVILLDNFTPDEIQEAVRIVGAKAEIEVSGDVTLDNVAAIAALGVDRVSVGAVTKHVQALDLSMRFFSD